MSSIIPKEGAMMISTSKWRTLLPTALRSVEGPLAAGAFPATPATRSMDLVVLHGTPNQIPENRRTTLVLEVDEGGDEAVLEADEEGAGVVDAVEEAVEELEAAAKDLASQEEWHQSSFYFILSYTLNMNTQSSITLSITMFITKSYGPLRFQLHGPQRNKKTSWCRHR